MDITLVVMAAGMGSRFGGLKQAQPVTDDGRGLLDFSVYDAIKAGFNKVVFIIRKEIEQDFKRLVGNRIKLKWSMFCRIRPFFQRAEQSLSVRRMQCCAVRIR